MLTAALACAAAVVVTATWGEIGGERVSADEAAAGAAGCLWAVRLLYRGAVVAALVVQAVLVNVAR